MIRAVEDEEWKMLQTILKRLHGEGEILTPDKRRDLANLLSEVLRRIDWAGDITNNLK